MRVRIRLTAFAYIDCLDLKNDPSNATPLNENTFENSLYPFAIETETELAGAQKMYHF